VKRAVVVVEDEFPLAEDHATLVARVPHPHPFLSWEVESADAKRTSFKTEAISPARLMRPETIDAPDSGQARYHVYAVIKNPDNPWSDRISVGRARNNDIVLGHHSISKLHAHITQKDAVLCITDTGSSNGTRVNGTRLTQGEPHFIRLGDSITFGGLVTRLLAAETIYDQLRSIT
jgi:hypothetical protein